MRVAYRGAVPHNSQGSSKMNVKPEIKVGMLVTDTSASSRYDKAVYRVTGHSSDRSIVEYVGTLRNGRLDSSSFPRTRDVSYRTTTNLREWR
jgi:hypothetical protein